MRAFGNLLYDILSYCRLSVDDGRLGENISIESQKILLEQYCKDHAIKNYEIYDDDGYSGTNFDRPGFSRMYDDIQKGLIYTVIVKDQSRFGRSYIDVGMYALLPDKLFWLLFSFRPECSCEDWVYRTLQTTFQPVPQTLRL